MASVSNVTAASPRSARIAKPLTMIPGAIAGTA
jgi:hypothetical protein